MTKPIVIVGTGSFGEVCGTYFKEFQTRQVYAYAANQEYISDSKFCGLPLIALEEMLVRCPPDEYDLFVAVGYRKMNRIRERLFSELSLHGYDFATFVHPGVRVWESTTIGRNCFIFEDNTLQPFTQVGDNSILWSGNHVGHHSIIGRNVFISSHVVISGSCRVGDNVFIGVNSSIHDGITIGEGTLIGAGSLIARDTDPNSVFSPPRTQPRDLSSFEVNF